MMWQHVAHFPNLTVPNLQRKNKTEDELDKHHSIVDNTEVNHQQCISSRPWVTELA